MWDLGDNGIGNDCRRKATGQFFSVIVTNFVVWLGGGYSYTLGGLLTCYTAAIPFYLKMLAGDLTWCAILFGLYELATYLSVKPSISNNKI